MKRGNTIFFGNAPRVRSYAAICGSKEREGVAGRYADIALSDDMYGESTYEKAECKMLSNAVSLAVEKGRLTDGDVDALLSGDLLNQIISASFAARDFQFPYLGLYSACSTMSEGMLLAAALVDGGYARNCVAATGSHFASAERQYRYPLELGCTRPPQSQWTVTGAGACVISADCGRIKLLNATLGRVRDWGVTDVNNMGAAMMPAAASTLLACFAALHAAPQDFDAVITGDLGAVGSELLCIQMRKEGYALDNHLDCGCLLYDRDEQPVKAGGSGAGCSAAVLCAHILPQLAAGRWRRVLFVATGALMSQATFLQGQTIPGIAHAVELAAPAGEGKA